MGPTGNPFEDLQPSITQVPPLNLPVIVPQMLKNDVQEILPERGTGLQSGNASPTRRGNPRNDLERFMKHFGIVK